MNHKDINYVLENLSRFIGEYLKDPVNGDYCKMTYTDDEDHFFIHWYTGGEITRRMGHLSYVVNQIQTMDIVKDRAEIAELVLMGL